MHVYVHFTFVVSALYDFVRERLADQDLSFYLCESPSNFIHEWTCVCVSVLNNFCCSTWFGLVTAPPRVVLSNMTETLFKVSALVFLTFMHLKLCTLVDWNNWLHWSALASVGGIKLGGYLDQLFEVTFMGRTVQGWLGSSDEDSTSVQNGR